MDLSIQFASYIVNKNYYINIIYIIQYFLRIYWQKKKCQALKEPPIHVNLFIRNITVFLILLTQKFSEICEYNVNTKCSRKTPCIQETKKN